MRVGILGSGLMGSKLGTLFARAGHEVVFSYARSQQVAAELIRDVGFEPLDAGPLRMARYSEAFALLVAHLAYDGEGGPELAYRFERFGEQ